ncbi:MAG TPA: hypothetical protein PLM81_00180 [Ginsengibacter sp.]|nr:hypothetical protein [Ginsengibacter sp.]HRP16693.1 hypothetical protein [Ginsengibacter sp.]HRP43353.1 hypothetical protein [Ginsengibacter sp.]
MEAENKPGAEAQEPHERSGKGRNILTAALLIALLGTWGYIIYDNNKNKEEKEELSEQVKSVDSARNELQNELNDATLRLDALKTENVQAAGMLQTKDKEISNLKSRIESILRDEKATKEQLDEARRLIGELKGNIDTFAAEIASLKLQNKALVEQNTVVTSQRDSALKIYDSATTVIREKENVIDVGSTLHASNFKIAGIRERNKGKEKETSRAKRVDKLRITFDLDENRITQSGEKDIYVVIKTPDGQPVSVEAFGSGKFRTRDGVERYFTKRVSVNYEQGKKQEVVVEWSQNSNFKTGKYTVEIYNNGFLIGEGTVNLKSGGLFG